MDFIYQYLFFLAKTFTFVVAFTAIIVLVVMVRQKKTAKHGTMELVDLSEQYQEMKKDMQMRSLDDEQLKVWCKAEKKQAKIEAKQKKAAAQDEAANKQKPRLFIIDFKGSVDAREVESLRNEITAILAIAQAEDEVLIKLESPGGVVHGYGLAASQLDRIKQRGLPLTVAIDKVAASGGYMMACVANRIVSAPFAIVGSIGVVAQLPNINRLLKKHDIDIELHTAGDFKRTLTVLGENSEQGREKFKQNLNEIHGLFKDFVSQHRPDLDINSVATGEYWFGTQAKQKGLVDDISTSDDLILQHIEDKQILSIHYAQRKKLVDKLSLSMVEAVDRLLLRWWQRGQKPLL